MKTNQSSKHWQKLMFMKSLCSAQQLSATLELCLFSQWRFLYNSSGEMDIALTFFTWHLVTLCVSVRDFPFTSIETGRMWSGDDREWFSKRTDLMCQTINNYGLELNSHRRQTMSQLWQQAWDLKHRTFDNVVPAAEQEHSAKTCCLMRSCTSAIGVQVLQRKSQHMCSPHLTTILSARREHKSHQITMQLVRSS